MALYLEIFGSFIVSFQILYNSGYPSAALASMRECTSIIDCLECNYIDSRRSQGRLGKKENRVNPKTKETPRVNDEDQYLGHDSPRLVSH